MIRTICAFALALMTSACAVYEPGTTVVNETTITSGTSITINYGTNDRKQPSRHQTVLSCSSINGLRDYLDYGELDRSCQLRQVTAARQIETYKSFNYGWVRVYVFQINGWEYYTYVASGGRSHPTERGVDVFSCGTIAELEFYINFNERAPSCAFRTMRSPVAVDQLMSRNGRVSVLEFVQNGRYYYTYQ
jgi:hypothetical protein